MSKPCTSHEAGHAPYDRSRFVLNDDVSIDIRKLLASAKPILQCQS